MHSSLLRNFLFIAVILTAAFFWYANRPEQIRASGLAYNLVYIEKTLNSLSAHDELPMLIMLHGAGDTPENFLSWYDDFTVPVRLIVFQGPFDYGRGYTWSRRQDTEDTRAVAQSINASIEELLDKYPTSGKPLVFGFSRGAILAYYLAVSSEHYAAVIPVSGYLDNGLTPEEVDPYFAYPQIYAFHGTQDQIIPIGRDRSSIQRLQALGIRASLEEFSSNHLPEKRMQAAIRKKISMLLLQPG